MRDIIDDPEGYQPEGVERAERHARLEGAGTLRRGCRGIGHEKPQYLLGCLQEAEGDAQEAGVSLDEMARRTGLSATALWRAENDLHRVGLLDLLPDYCAALDKTFEITIRDADQK